MTPGALTVKMQCVQCKAQQTINADSVKPGEHPLCPRCFMPLATLSVKGKATARIDWGHDG